MDASGTPMAEDRHPLLGDVMKNMIKRPPAEYTPEMRRLHMEGDVIVLVLVGRDGRVHDTRLVLAPDDLMIEPALEAARNYVFKPIEIDGNPVEIRVQITTPFRMH